MRWYETERFHEIFTNILLSWLVIVIVGTYALLISISLDIMGVADFGWGTVDIKADRNRSIQCVNENDENGKGNNGIQ